MPQIEKRLSDLEAKAGETLNLPRIPTAADELAMSRYLRLIELGRPIPRILKQQIKKCRDTGPIGPGVQAMFDEVLERHESPGVDRAPRPLKRLNPRLVPGT